MVKVKVGNDTAQGGFRLARFGAYQKANELFDLAVTDLADLSKLPGLQRLVSQQYASLDSIAANIEEGYGRGSRREYAQFLIIARGSAQESAGRYRRLRHWLPETIVTERVALCNEIIALLTRSICTLRERDGT
jgi:four helix bundle protein